MKNYPVLIFGLALTLATGALHAQIAPQPKEMSLGVREALTMEFPTAAPKLVADEWSTYLKEAYNARTRYDRRSKEHLADDANIPALGMGNPVDLYATIEEVGSGSRLNLWVDLGTSGFLNIERNPERYLEAEKLLLQFREHLTLAETRLELAAQEKALADLQTELKKLERDYERYTEEIARAEETINKARESIEQNQVQQGAAKASIEAQQQVVDEVKQRLGNGRRRN